MDGAQDHDPPQIVFFDVETLYATSVIVEFGAILVCPNTLSELRSYSTLVRPADPSLLPAVFHRTNGINRDSLAHAPTFADIADTVYELLHERIWAGHNISGFDRIHIEKAFMEMNRRPPEPKAIVDSLPLLTKTFGTRAGNMKMASLAKYFGLGQQTHRSLDDVRMNLEVIKHCAAIMFLESSFPNVFRVNSGVPPNTPPRNYSNRKSLLLNGGSSNMKNKFIVQDAHDDDLALQQQIFGLPPPPQISSSQQADLSEASSSNIAFAILKPHEIFISRLATSLVLPPPSSYHDSLRIQLLHDGVPFQISCADLKIRSGMNGRFHNEAGLPKLSFEVDASQSLCEVLESCDAIALSSFLDSARISSDHTWKPMFVNYPTVRLQVPISKCGDATIFETKVYKKGSSSGIAQRLKFNEEDNRELSSLLMPGNLVDAIFSLDQYEYKQSAGLRLVAKKLIFHK